jgi:regulator of replication initiation timing
MNNQPQSSYYNATTGTTGNYRAAFNYDDSYDHIYNTSPDELVDKLLESYKYLQMANYRIGYLESLLDNYKKQTKLIAQLQTQSNKAQSLARENAEIKQQLPEILAQIRRIDTLEMENQDLRQQLEYAESAGGKIGDIEFLQLKAQLLKSEEIISKLWPKITCLLLGEPEDSGHSRRNSVCSMNDYYSMLQQRLKK